MERLRIIHPAEITDEAREAFFSPPIDEAVVFLAGEGKSIFPGLISVTCNLQEPQGIVQGTSLLNLAISAVDHTVYRRQLQEMHLINPGTLPKLLELLQASSGEMGLESFGLTVLNRFVSEAQSIINSLN